MSNAQEAENVEKKNLIDDGTWDFDDYGGAAPTADKHRVLSTIPLIGLVFFNVSGGPYGIEEAVSSAGPKWVLLALLVMPFVWSIPEALVAAELSVAIPADGGDIVWVTRAFGPLMGCMQGLMKNLYQVIDAAIYPTLMLDYLVLAAQWKIGFYELYLLKLVTVCVLTCVQLFGVELVGWVNVFLGIMGMAPFIAVAVAALMLDGSATVQMNTANLSVGYDFADVNWGVFLTMMFWNFSGFNFVGVVAGRTANPVRTVPKVLAGTLLLVVASFLIPLVFTIALEDTTADEGMITWQAWHDGYFGVIIRKTIGEWAQIWMVGGGMLAAIGLYLSDMCGWSYQCVGMATTGLLPAAFCWESRWKTPWVGIVTGFVLVLALMPLDFSAIVSLSSCVACLINIMQFSAAFWLRVKEADLERPIKLPGGMPGFALVICPPFVFCLLLFGLSDWFPVIATLVLVVVCLIAYKVMEVAKARGWLHFHSASGPQPAVALVPLRLPRRSKGGRQKERGAYVPVSSNEVLL